MALVYPQFVLEQTTGGRGNHQSVRARPGLRLTLAWNLYGTWQCHHQGTLQSSFYLTSGTFFLFLSDRLRFTGVSDPVPVSPFPSAGYSARRGSWHALAVAEQRTAPSSRSVRLLLLRTKTQLVPVFHLIEISFGDQQKREELNYIPSDLYTALFLLPVAATDGSLFFPSSLAATPSQKRIAAGGAWVSDAASACLKVTALDDQTVIKVWMCSTVNDKQMQMSSQWSHPVS